MRPRSALSLLVALLVATAGCSTGDAPQRTASGPTVEIVGQNFTEADVVSQLYRALLDQAGFSASVESIGGRDIYLDQLEKGSVQVAVDALSATTEALNHQANGDDALPVATPDVEDTLGQLTMFGDEAGLTALGPTRAELKSGYAVTAAFAARHRLETLSDLGRSGLRVRMAASPDCAERDDCARGLENVYRVALSEVRPLGSGTADSKAALLSGQVQLAQVATTDPQIGSELVLLADDKHILNAENLTPIVNSAWLAEHARARAAIDRLAGVLTTNDLRAMSAQVNSGQLSARAAALAYLRTKRLT